MATKRAKIPPSERLRKRREEAKKRAKIYRQSQTFVKLALNYKERTVLLDKMAVEGWGSMAGYIRDVLFGDTLEVKFVNVIKGKRGDSLLMAIRELLEEIHKDLYYANYIAGEKAKEFEDKPGVTQKQFSLYMEHLAKHNKTMAEFYRYAQELSERLGMAIDAKTPEFIETIPDDLLKSLASDWNLAPNDPYLMEQSRREKLATSKKK